MRIFSVYRKLSVLERFDCISRGVASNFKREGGGGRGLRGSKSSKAAWLVINIAVRSL